MTSTSTSVRFSTIRPGLLVSLKTTVAGGIRYAKRDLDCESQTASGAIVARWETERTIEDPIEHERAIKVRGKIRSLITGICARSDFGLLCPESKQADLESAVAESRQLAETFNASATVTRINVYILAGRIAPDDVEAVRAIKNEVSDLLDRMESGVRSLNVETIRDAANRARSLGQMLEPGSQKRIAEAIDAARAAARRIVKAGDTAAIEVDMLAIEKLDYARLAFLDIDEPGLPADVTASPADAPAVDFEPIDIGQSDVLPIAAAPLAPASPIDIDL